MKTFSCPNCSVTLSVAIHEALEASESSAAARSTSPHGPRPTEELDALRDFIRWHPGQHQTTDLHRLYEAERVSHGWPELGQRNFGIGLQQIGVQRIRSTYRRAWLIPQEAHLNHSRSGSSTD